MRSGAPVRIRGLAAVYIALAAFAIGCGGGGTAGGSDTSDEDAATTSAPQPRERLPETVQTLGIDATEYAFEIDPDELEGLEAGWTRLEFDNVGQEPHQVMFARIKDGVDMAELAAAGANDSSGAGAIEFVDMIGGVSYIGPGQQTTALVDLTEGPVLAMCYVPDRNGVAHALLGMSTTLTVGEGSASPDPAGADGAGEEVLGTFELAEDGYQVPDPLDAGWYKVENTDTALHELSLLELGATVDEAEAGLLVEDLAANRTPEVELEAVGGMGAISPGYEGYLHLDLEDGDYLAVDFMPDPGEPRPHMLDGYWALFSTGDA